MPIQSRPAGEMSWGRYFRFPQATVPLSRDGERIAGLEEAAGKPVLPHGMGRSYGDVCLLEDGVCLDATGLNKVRSFDRESGLLSCEAGCTMEQLLHLIVPAGWFFPVTPGTKFITIGGAVANDIHGKNHHCSGTFGRHITKMEMWRSGEGITTVEPGDALFQATVGGLGLTGLILTVTFQCIPIGSASIQKQSIQMRGVEEFFELSEESDQGGYFYTVAWIDCLAPVRALGRGQFYRGNHARVGAREYQPKKHLAVPFELPFSAINKLSIQAFNRLYRSRQFSRIQESITDIDSFFYPLDGIDHWNRLYGRSGLFQFQCVTPIEAPTAVRQLLKTVTDSGMGSPLVVLKKFGPLESPGMLTFPSHGYTLAIDFPNRGPEVLKLLKSLEKITVEAGGSIYPAKDATMSSESFHKGFPRWSEFARLIDPMFSSSFFRRVCP